MANSHPSPKTSHRRGIVSYFFPFSFVSVTTEPFDSTDPQQTITLEFGMVYARFTCQGQSCDPTRGNAYAIWSYQGLYGTMFFWWYKIINNGGFAPYPNIPVPSSDPALCCLCLAAIAMGFATASIVAVSTNAQAQKREVLNIAPFDKTQLVFKGCRHCPPPGHSYTIQRGILYSSLALTCQVSAP